MRVPLLLAAAFAGLGLALRLAVPVTPVDGPFRAVLRAYGAGPGDGAAAIDRAHPSNTGETSPP